MHCVVFPDRSHPSNTINAPRLGTFLHIFLICRSRVTFEWNKMHRLFYVLSLFWLEKMFKSNDVPMWRTTVWINNDDDINDICVIFAALFTRAFWVVNSAIQQNYLRCMGNLRYQLNKWIFGYMNELQTKLDRDEYDIWSTRFHANRDGRYNAFSGVKFSKKYFEKHAIDNLSTCSKRVYMIWVFLNASEFVTRTFGYL